MTLWELDGFLSFFPEINWPSSQQRCRHKASSHPVVPSATAFETEIGNLRVPCLILQLQTGRCATPVDHQGALFEPLVPITLELLFQILERVVGQRLDRCHRCLLHWLIHENGALILTPLLLSNLATTLWGALHFR